MSKLVLSVSMSLDGFVAGADDGPGCGAVITGRHTFQWAGQWGGDHHDGVPIFVLTRTEPEQPVRGLDEQPPDACRLRLVSAVEGEGVLHLRYAVDGSAGSAAITADGEPRS